MKAVAVFPASREIKVVEQPEPSIGEADEVRVRVLDVGICGTDREEAAGGRARAPAGRGELVLGHEMLGQVVYRAGFSGTRQADEQKVAVGRCPAGASCWRQAAPLRWASRLRGSPRT